MWSWAYLWPELLQVWIYHWTPDCGDSLLNWWTLEENSHCLQWTSSRWGQVICHSERAEILTARIIHFLKKMCVCVLSVQNLCSGVTGACQWIAIGLLMHSEWLLDGCLMPKTWMFVHFSESACSIHSQLMKLKKTSPLPNSKITLNCFSVLFYLHKVTEDLLNTSVVKPSCRTT